MSHNENQAAAGHAVKTTVQQALEAFTAQMLRACEQLDPAGNKQLVLPLAQAFIDLQVLQLKVEAIFEELGAEQLVDPAKLTARLVQKAERETKALKQQNDAKPNIAIASAVAGGINGRGDR